MNGRFATGRFFPPLSNVHAWIEWLHRLFAALIGLFGLVTLAIAWRRYRDRDRRVLRMTVAAALLFALQSALGAIVVFLDLPPTFVTLHLGVAMLLLGALLAAAVIAWYQPQLSGHRRSSVSLGAVHAAFALLIILTGALVRGSGATLACTEWPLCDGGALLPIEQGPLAVIHMIHRLSVAAMGAFPSDACSPGESASSSETSSATGNGCIARLPIPDWRRRDICFQRGWSVLGRCSCGAGGGGLGPTRRGSGHRTYR